MLWKSSGILMSLWWNDKKLHRKAEKHYCLPITEDSPNNYMFFTMTSMESALTSTYHCVGKP
jgi:hypothetical protein